MKGNSREQTLRHRHIPQRSCIACRDTKNNGELIRLVCSGDTVSIYTKDKKTGRGAYLCPTRQCWETGLKGNRLEYALRTKLTSENRQALVEYGKNLPQREGARDES